MRRPRACKPHAPGHARGRGWGRDAPQLGPPGRARLDAGERGGGGGGLTRGGCGGFPRGTAGSGGAGRGDHLGNARRAGSAGSDDSWTSGARSGRASQRKLLQTPPARTITIATRASWERRAPGSTAAWRDAGLGPSPGRHHGNGGGA